MQLAWISSTLLFLNVVFATNLLTEINDKSPIKTEKGIYNTATPFATRGISQATLWNINKKSFAFHFERREDCQEVWLCSTDATVTDIKNAAATTAGSWCSDYTRFRPLEASVTFGLGAAGAAGDKAVYPWTHALFKYDAAANKYKLKVAAKERDIAGKVTDFIEKEISLTGLPLIVTSSPYCFPIVQDDSGVPVDSVIVGEVEMAFPMMRMADAVHEKKHNHLLVPTHVKKYTTSTAVKCPPIWLSEFDTAEDKWHTRSKAIKQKAMFMKYELDRSEPACTHEKEKRVSFKLRIDDPAKCTWIRLCILDDDQQLCSNPKKSVELLIAYKMFVGIDSDEARPMETQSKNLKLIRFQLTNAGNGNTRFTMSYGFASDEGAVQHHMFGDELKGLLAGGNMKVGLVRDSECTARLVTDRLLETPPLAGIKQCLTVAACQIVIPEQFEQFPGSDGIKLADYNPDQ